ncbi:MAG: hypothetical protein E6J90_37800 [Deltaproteobacteria bacterium]|nr:MAG: hypothetical protein E6J90_37800 [Deltaproteobacteria bacterium]TMQ19351.1 MAG: hypothetical protein E6J91_06395 [Deltaproteobacteria bacterium]
MMSVIQITIGKLQTLIGMNPSIDWRMIVLDNPGGSDALTWCDLEPKVMTPLLKAYQRLVRILPASEEHRALRLLESGLHSAIQIANLSQDEFARRWAVLFPGDDALGLKVHRAALRRRGELLLHHIDEVQHNEPHYRAARFK